MQLLSTLTLPFLIFGIILTSVCASENTGNQGADAHRYKEDIGKIQSHSSSREYKEFARIVSLFFEKKSDTSIAKIKDEFTKKPERQETISAARTMLALALANGLMKPKEGDIGDHVTEFTKILTTESDEKIVDKLTSYFQDTSPLLYAYRNLINTAKNPIEAMSSAMEHVSAKDTKTADPAKNDVQPKSRTHTLGCKFSDDKYTYSLSRFGVLPKGRWEKESAALVMKFDSMKLFDEFVDKLREKIIPTVLESTKYNDVDQLIR